MKRWLSAMERFAHSRLADSLRHRRLRAHATYSALRSHMPQKLRAGILAATGTVGQRFIELLANGSKSNKRQTGFTKL